MPAWLAPGASFGEEGEELDLDDCVVKVAQLRSEAVDLERRISRSLLSDKPSFRFEMESLIKTAQKADQELLSWSQHLPADWMYTIHELPESSMSKTGSNINNAAFDGIAHVYESKFKARLWNRYRSARLIATGMTVRTSTHPVLSQNEGLQRQRQAAICHQKVLLNDICASVPYHLGRISTRGSSGSRDGDTPDQAAIDNYENVKAREAFYLVWPLNIACAVSVVPEDQLRWMKRQLYLCSQITGNGILQSLSKEPHIGRWYAGVKPNSEGQD